MLLFWRANVDIQYVGESSQILNQYITSYVTKAEKNETEAIWQAMDANKNAVSKIKSLAAKVFHDREVGSYEIADELLGNPLHGSSRAVSWLGVGFADQRKRKVKNFDALSKLSEDSMNTFCNNIIDTYYPNRSVDLEEVSLHDLAANFEYCSSSAKAPKSNFIPQRSGWGGFKKRGKEILIKYPYISLNGPSPEKFYHNLL